LRTVGNFFSSFVQLSHLWENENLRHYHGCKCRLPFKRWKIHKGFYSWVLPYMFLLLSILFGTFAIMQSRSHLLFAWQFLLEKIAHSFFCNSSGLAIMIAKFACICKSYAYYPLLKCLRAGRRYMTLYVNVGRGSMVVIVDIDSSIVS